MPAVALQEPEFRAAAAARFQQLRAGVWTDAAIAQAIRQQIAYVHDAALRSFARWAGLGLGWAAPAALAGAPSHSAHAPCWQAQLCSLGLLSCLPCHRHCTHTHTPFSPPLHPYTAPPHTHHHQRSRRWPVDLLNPYAPAQPTGEAQLQATADKLTAWTTGRLAWMEAQLAAAGGAAGAAGPGAAGAQAAPAGAGAAAASAAGPSSEPARGEVVLVEAGSPAVHAAG